MKKENLLFYNEYEQFYEMAEKSIAFQKFCCDSFGQDFSQDGFSDIEQIDMILPESVKLIVFICQSTIRLAKSKKCTLIMLNQSA